MDYYLHYEYGTDGNIMISLFPTIWAFGWYKTTCEFKLFIGPLVLTFWKGR
jgi:hypothetical protein